MSLEVFYTALIRATCTEDIYLDMTKLKKCYKSEFEMQTFKEISTELKTRNVYEISDCDMVYVGMTMEDIEKRIAEHVADPKSAVYKFMKNPVIKLIGKVNGTEN